MKNKKLLLILFLILIFTVGNTVYALDSTGTINKTGEVVGFTIDGVEIQNKGKAKLKVYDSQILDLMFYFDYLSPDDVPDGSGLFVRVKDSKENIVQNFAFPSMHWVSFKGTSRIHAKQELLIDDRYKSNEIYCFEVCDRIQVAKDGYENAIVRNKYYITFDIQKHEHLYDIKTLRCSCGNTATINFSGLHANYYNLSESPSTYTPVDNISDYDLTLWANDLKFVDQNKKVQDTFTLEINYVDRKETVLYTRKLNDYQFASNNNESFFGGQKVIVSPSSYSRYFTYNFEKGIPGLKKGKAQINIKIGDTIVKTLYANLDIVENIDTNFNDLSNSHWAYEDIMILKNNGVISGYEDGSFKPDNLVTREEFFQMLNKAKIQNCRYGTFNDVKSDRWSFEACKRYGISLAQNGMLYPTQPIQRQEVAKVLVMCEYLYGNEFDNEQLNTILKQCDELKKKFYDLNNCDNTMLPYIYYATSHEIMNGYSNSEFGPEGTLTRAQAAAVIRRIKFKYEVYKDPSKEEKITTKLGVKDGMQPIENAYSELISKIDKNQGFALLKSKNATVLFYTFSNVFNAYIDDAYNVGKKTIGHQHKQEYGENSFDISYLKEYASRYDFEYDEEIDKIIFKCDIKGVKYYSESKRESNSVKMGGLYDIIAFKMLHQDEIDDFEFAILTNYNFEDEISKFILNNSKSVYYGINKFAKMTINKKNNSFTVKCDDREYDIFENSNEIISDDDVELLSQAFGFSYYPTYSQCIVAYGNKYVAINRNASAMNVEAKKIYSIIAYILNNNQTSNKPIEIEQIDNKIYNLTFDDILLEKERYAEKTINTSTIKTYQNVIVFNRPIKSLDVDVLNSNNESVLLSTNIVSYKTNGSNTAINVTHQIAPGEKYTIVLKNFVDVDNNATAKKSEYRFYLNTSGEKIKKIGKSINNVDIKISKPITRDSVIEIIPDGDLANNEVLKIAYKPFNSGSYRTSDLNKYKFTIDDVYSTMRYDNVAAGDTITLEAYVYVYRGAEGTIGTERDEKPNGSITITLP